MLIAARALQGLFGALLAPSVLSLLTTTFADPRERGRAFGIYASIAIGGAAFGLILGGFLTQYLDWRWCLYVNLPIAAIVAFGAFTMIPTLSGHPGIRLDIPGVILGSAAGWWPSSTGSVRPPPMAGLGRGHRLRWRLPSPCWRSSCSFRSRCRTRCCPCGSWPTATAAGAFLTIILAVLGMYGTFLFLTYLLQTVDHYSPLKTGVAFLPLMAVNGLAATQLASRLMPHLRTRLLVVPGLLLAAAGVALLTRLTPGASYVTHVLPTEILLGLGLGIALVPCISTATTNAEPRDVGITSATTNTSQQIGASIGTALLNTIAATATASYLARAPFRCRSGGPGHGARLRHGQCVGGRVHGARCRGRGDSHHRPSGSRRGHRRAGHRRAGTAELR